MKQSPSTVTKSWASILSCPNSIPQVAQAWVTSKLRSPRSRDQYLLALGEDPSHILQMASIGETPVGSAQPGVYYGHQRTNNRQLL